jgi:hypothetical protein
MKKVLAALLAVMLIACTSVTAFGATKEEVKSVQKAAAEYVVIQFSSTGFTATDAKYFEHAVKGGADVSAYKDAFLNSAADVLNSQQSSMDNAVQIISAFEALGEYPASFSRDDAAAMLASADPVIYSPYNYVQAIKLCKAFGLDNKAAAYANALCSTYTMGTGPVFWGDPTWMSGDDVAAFVLALAPLKDDYSDYIEDALAILENYYSEDGYINAYTGANTDTTGLALAAYAALGEKEKADEIYDTLVANFSDAATGGFTADYDALYATADALTGIEEYLPLADEDPAPAASADGAAPAAEAEKAAAKKSPSTGSEPLYAAFAAAALSATLIVALKKKEQ